MNPQSRLVNSLPTILNSLLGALLFLLCFKFPVCGIIQLERKFEVYPIVSHETLGQLDQMRAELEAFDLACAAHQTAQRDLSILPECTYSGWYWQQECEQKSTDAGTVVEVATSAMYTAVARRKEIAARADWGLLKSMMVGGQAYTHSTWLCAPTYASFTTQINVGFTPTYNSSS